VQRVGAAVEAARRYNIVLTARADVLGKGVYGVEETIKRLVKFQELGADVGYAPGVPSLQDLQAICRAVTVPVNHVMGQGVSGLTRSQIAHAGVRRISVGGSLARAAGGALVEIARQIADGNFSALETAPSWNAIRKGEIR
jgi:2-methylisocitrate lyase-like PEP mutase family enzyme